MVEEQTPEATSAEALVKEHQTNICVISAGIAEGQIGNGRKLITGYEKPQLLRHPTVSARRAIGEELLNNRVIRLHPSFNRNIVSCTVVKIVDSEGIARLNKCADVYHFRFG
jgi:hypothetical protein